MGDTAISWTDKTWNPTRGCWPVSSGCKNCYAAAQAARIVRMGTGAAASYKGLARVRDGIPLWTGEGAFVADHLADPLTWRKPVRVFVDSMSDLFFEKFTDDQIAAVFGVMAAARQHTFQVLTKRPARMLEWFRWLAETGGLPVALREAFCWLPDYEDVFTAASTFDAPARWPLPNVWIGVSVENQAAADERIPLLLKTPAAVRFLSCEPLLGPVNVPWSAFPTWHDVPTLSSRCERRLGDEPALGWVIAGCESGPGARPCDVAWLRSLRDQCAAGGVPYFLKQAAHGAVFDAGPGNGYRGVSADRGSKRKAGGVIELPYLDGVQHAAFPGSPDRLTT